MSVVIYELNEIPRKVFDFFADENPDSAIARLRANSDLYLTDTADLSPLSPWITWPTLHRGVSGLDHGISDLGQDLTAINAEFPSVYSMLAKSNVSVGMFGSLHSYPLPENCHLYSFYVPDTFAPGSEALPADLQYFQAFNVGMVKASGRNVSSGFSLSAAIRFLLRSPCLGLTANTFYRIVRQLLAERVNRDRLVRRRSIQTELAFDLFFKQLKSRRPDVSVFFTNHLASSMHRYWPTIFPDDYPADKFDSEWLDLWRDEIPHALAVAEMQIHRLKSFCDESGAELVITSSMGQAAVPDAEVVNNQILITDVYKLMQVAGLDRSDWSLQPSMAPRVVIRPRCRDIESDIASLGSVVVNGEPLEVVVTTTGDVRLKIEQFNVQGLDVRIGGQPVDSSDAGIDVIKMQDRTGSYAYHIPEGILVHYRPHNRPSNRMHWEKVSVLDYAPSLLQRFGCIVPPYMKGRKDLLCRIAGEP